MLYNSLSSYLKREYGGRVRKLCIDGGFTCPNRDGTKGVGGCIFCGGRGAGEHIEGGVSIGEQVERLLVGRGDGGRYIAYFQNFTNTYAPTEVLRRRYDEALTDGRIAVLDVATRPDCIDRDVAELLASYKSRLDVWVELGLQTASDETARLINRRYLRDEFENAMEILSSYGLKTVIHVMLGLPGEGAAETAETAAYLSRFRYWGIKLHSLYVMEGTALADMYRRGEYAPPTMEEYIDGAAYMLTHISPEAVIHRLTGDCPAGLLVAPEWNTRKNDILLGIRRRLESGGLRQGIYYEGV